MPAIKRKAAKPRRGRPPKADARMGSPILVRLSPLERETLQEAADGAGQPLSAWMRESALMRAKGGVMDDQIRRLRDDEDSDELRADR